MHYVLNVSIKWGNWNRFLRFQTRKTLFYYMKIILFLPTSNVGLREKVCNG